MHQVTALFISIAIEVPCSGIVLRLLRKPHYRRGALVAIGSTMLSHPFAWAANTVWLTGLPFAERALLIECGVVIFEAAFYIWLVPLRVREGFLVSLVANSASFGFGLLIWSLQRG